MKNLEIKKTYKIGDREFSSKEEALRETAKTELTQLVESGVDHVIENSATFLNLLKIVSNNSMKGIVIKGGSGTLKALDELLMEEGAHIERSTFDWPVYHIHLNDGTSHTIRYIGKVWQLYDLFVEGGIDALLKYKIK